MARLFVTLFSALLLGMAAPNHGLALDPNLDDRPRSNSDYDWTPERPIRPIDETLFYLTKNKQRLRKAAIAYNDLHYLFIDDKGNTVPVELDGEEQVVRMSDDAVYIAYWFQPLYPPGDSSYGVDPEEVVFLLGWDKTWDNELKAYRFRDLNIIWEFDGFNEDAKTDIYHF